MINLKLLETERSSAEALVDFSLTDEQQQLRRTVREFAESEIAPHVMEWDEASQFPSEIIPKLAELGLFGVIFPEKYGGAGPGLHRIRAGDRGAFARRWLGGHDRRGAQFALHQSHLQVRDRGAAAEVRRAAGAGQKAGLLVADRAGSGFGRRRHRATATRAGDGWVINGAKTFTTNGHYADVCVAMAVTDPAKGRTGFRHSSWRRARRDFAPGKKENKLGMRASDTSEMIFSDCRVPASSLLGKEGEAFINILQVLDGGRISIAAHGAGNGAGRV